MIGVWMRTAYQVLDSYLRASLPDDQCSKLLVVTPSLLLADFVDTAL